ncbi:MAG: hypothetical protein V3S00_02480, partial [Dehalococcoidia bacterium]
MAESESHPDSTSAVISPDALAQHTFDYIRDRDIIHAGEHLLVAVSGGPDSTALLLLLARLS